MADSTDTGSAAEGGAGGGGRAGPESPPEEDASLAAIVADVGSLWSEAAAQLRGVSELAFLELELAADSLLKIFWATLVLAGLVLCTWLFLLGILAAEMLEFGVPLPLTLLAAAAVNLLAAGALFSFIRFMARDMQFRNLRRYLAQQSRERSPEQT